ncbi:carboxymuconolactone decarboxylase family protein [Chitinophaga nivalis]|uniref:Carboxymuconolactone decarboxylase family protein n=1 Tax=Chitinophaga nivalis TaxID=2991709 RepID=A0ABT3IMK7_9BACT|nr:carboxymuconolactone decarboxylase family protein [Chitinophaga nivalis]MCW3465349.1 carboxymuconolactone decarboxylase family protein [Chitinophaga nivalis]MCW3484959.1 carboxymuconolactone decarboxylase family protein [Chitinophaga nivalis]
MMTHFSDPSDKQFAKDIIQGAPQQSKSWLAFDHAVMETPSAIPQKYKELIAIGIALTTQCPYCIDKHVQQARQQGMTEAELSETIMIAAALRSGAAIGYGLLATKIYRKEGL